MSTLATPEEIAEARQDVERLESEVTNARYQLQHATEDTEIDSLAARLDEARRQARMARNILGDMVAGAGDFHDWSEDR
jgi:hypothetical protein